MKPAFESGISPAPATQHRLRRSRVKLSLGAVLVAAAFLAFLTVADDLRHTGELFVGLGLLVSGAALLFDGFFPRASSILAPAWLPAGIALGALAGAQADRVVAGVCIGAAVGLALGRLRRTPSSLAGTTR